MACSWDEYINNQVQGGACLKILGFVFNLENEELYYLKLSMFYDKNDSLPSTQIGVLAVFVVVNALVVFLSSDTSTYALIHAGSDNDFVTIC